MELQAEEISKILKEQQGGQTPGGMAPSPTSDKPAAMSTSTIPEGTAAGILS